MTTIAIPKGYNWRELLVYMMKNHNMEMTGGLGPSIGMVNTGGVCVRVRVLMRVCVCVMCVRVRVCVCAQLWTCLHVCVGMITCVKIQATIDNYLNEVPSVNGYLYIPLGNAHWTDGIQLQEDKR